MTGTQVPSSVYNFHVQFDWILNYATVRNLFWEKLGGKKTWLIIFVVEKVRKTNPTSQNPETYF